MYSGDGVCFKLEYACEEKTNAARFVSKKIGKIVR